jgi:starch synthase (maltosyl-transferring)
MFYEKATPDRSNVILVAVSLDPERPQSANVELPLWRWGLPDGASLQCADLISGASFSWTGKWQRLTLDPSYPFAIWRARPLAA